MQKDHAYIEIGVLTHSRVGTNRNNMYVEYERNN